MIDALSHNVRSRLEYIQSHPEDYSPNQTITHELGKKSLVMLIGPCATGKSYVIDQIITSNPDYKKSRSFTTRPPRPDDTPETIRYIDWTDHDIATFCDDIESGNFVNFTFHPKTGEVYGTALQDHPGAYNLMPTLANSVAQLETLPFASAPKIGLVTPPHQWDAWFATREFNNPHDREARIGEGISSLEWLLEHDSASIVTNTQSMRAAHAIQRIVASGLGERDEQTADELLGHLTSLPR